MSTDDPIALSRFEYKFASLVTTPIAVFGNGPLFLPHRGLSGQAKLSFAAEVTLHGGPWQGR